MAPVTAFDALNGDDPGDVIRFLLDACRVGQCSTLVILTDIIEGASRPLGTLMAIRDDGQYVGQVSGGCVESTLVQEACAAMAKGQDSVCRFGQGSPWFDIVLPCRGGIGLHLHVVRDPLPLMRFIALRESRSPLCLLYDSIGQSLDVQDGMADCVWKNGIFTAAFRPDPQILLFGRGLESRFLRSLAEAAHVQVIEGDNSAIDLRARDRYIAIVLLYHDLESELPVLRAALGSSAFYIGCLGSPRTQDRRLEALRQAGYGPEQLSRLRGPIGLFGPSREARSLAISILAEIFSLLEARRLEERP